MVGRNGVGKTSLMRAISSYDIPNFPVYLRVVHVLQEVQGDETSVIESVLTEDVERQLLLEEERKLMRTLESEEVEAAKAQASAKEDEAKSRREAERISRKQKAQDEEADSAARLGPSVDQMLDSMKQLDLELNELEEDEFADDAEDAGESMDPLPPQAVEKTTGKTKRLIA